MANDTTSPRRDSVSQWLPKLLPMENGSKDIRALDGLRAVAALSVVLYHTGLRIPRPARFSVTPPYNDWEYLETGVHLFFILSGFLLFLPYARAMLHGRDLPKALTFYKRRALRILPAYWVCLVILIILPTTIHYGPLTIQDLLLHLTLFHDDSPVFNSEFEGPFWTLAVEAQFYMLLPLIAFGISRLVGATRSTKRLCAGVLLFILLAMGIRTLDAHLMEQLPHLSGSLAAGTYAFIMVTMGSQGKFLEVFGVGMFCAVLYIVTVEDHRLPQHVTRWLGLGMLPLALALIYPMLTKWNYSRPPFQAGQHWGIDVICYPLLFGVGYGALLLATVWGNPLLKVTLGWYPLRFIGLISYSLYLWHLPIIFAFVLPPSVHVFLPLRVVCAFIVAYLSYQFVERPFLRRRQRTNSVPSGAIAASHAVVATPVNMLTYAQREAASRE